VLCLYSYEPLLGMSRQQGTSFWIASFRDVMATGKPILDKFGRVWGQDNADSNYLVSSLRSASTQHMCSFNHFLLCT